MDENVTNTEETVHEKENGQTGKAVGSCLPLAADMCSASSSIPMVSVTTGRA